jgi:hypothetical protein
MYGVTDELDLSSFVGTTLETIAIGISQISFNFDPDCSLVSEGEWILLGADGSIVDRAADLANRDAYRIHVCLGRRVVAAVPEPPKAISVTFDSGHVLRLVDDVDQYESFHIYPADIHI